MLLSPFYPLQIKLIPLACGWHFCFIIARMRMWILTLTLSILILAIPDFPQIFNANVTRVEYFKMSHCSFSLHFPQNLLLINYYYSLKMYNQRVILVHILQSLHSLRHITRCILQTQILYGFQNVRLCEKFYFDKWIFVGGLWGFSRSQWSCGLRRESTAARWLGLWVRMPIPVVVRSKAWVYGRSLTGIVGSNADPSCRAV